MVHEISFQNTIFLVSENIKKKKKIITFCLTKQNSIFIQKIYLIHFFFVTINNIIVFKCNG